MLAVSHCGTLTYVSYKEKITLLDISIALRFRQEVRRLVLRVGTEVFPKLCFENKNSVGQPQGAPMLST